MRDVIDSTDFFDIIDEQYWHCQETQFKHYCKNCGEFAGCYFCEFDPDQPCENCQPLVIDSTLTETKEI